MLIFIEIIAVLLIAYAILALTLFFMQPKFLYKPLKDITYTPEEMGLDFENLFFQTPDGLKINGWFVPASNAEFTILFCHGNGGNIAHRLDSINVFHNLGLNCLIFDYRGYGNSNGNPSEEGTYYDAKAAYKWLTEKKNISPDNIIIFGRSLGGAIAAQLAMTVGAKALVIESSFTSYANIGKKFYPYMPVHWFAKFNYPTLDYVKQVNCPVLIIHSRNDEIIPFEFGRQLFEAANEPKEFIELSGSHNDGFLASSEVYKKGWVKWLKFLKKYQSQHQHQAS